MNPWWLRFGNWLVDSAWPWVFVGAAILMVFALGICQRGS